MHCCRHAAPSPPLLSHFFLMSPPLSLSPSLFVLFLLSSLSFSFCHSIPGQSGSSPLLGSWRWSYLDATPSAPGLTYPFKLGVGDREQRDRNGERYVPAIRYAHSAVQFEYTMIITHG